MSVFLFTESPWWVENNSKKDDITQNFPKSPLGNF